MSTSPQQKNAEHTLSKDLAGLIPAAIKEVVPLSEHPILKFLPPHLARKLESSAQLRSFPQGHIIFNEGEPSVSVVLVLAGKIDVRKLNQKGEYESALQYEAGGDFGEFGVRDGLGRVGQAVVVEDSIIAEIPAQDFLDVLYGEAVDLGKFLNLRNSMIARRVGELLFEQRLAAEIQRERAEAAGNWEKLVTVTARIVHDERNMLHVGGMQGEMIQFYAEEGINGNMDPNEALKLITENMPELMKSLGRSAEMTKRILEFAQGHRGLRIAPINLSSLLDEIASSNCDVLHRKSIALTVTPADWEMEGDSLALVSVFQNLIKNAEQALEKRGGPGKISIRADIDNDNARIIVKDNGPGIDQKILPGLFEQFVTGAKGGVGLGLYNVKRIISSHKGTISVESSESGTTFTIMLPKGPDSTI